MVKHICAGQLWKLLRMRVYTAQFISAIPNSVCLSLLGLLPSHANSESWLQVYSLKHATPRYIVFAFVAAPAVDETLYPDDALKILVEILEAQNNSFYFGLSLGLQLHVVEAIHSRYQEPKDRLLHVIIEFLRQAKPIPTWRVIVDALRSPAVNLPRLAGKVEAAHFPDPTPTRDVVPETTSTGKIATHTLPFNYHYHACSLSPGY